jgi:regulator of RNase E activity RraA
LTATLTDQPASIQKPTAKRNRLIAPISTVLYVRKSDVDNGTLDPTIEAQANIPKGVNWTEIVAPGTITLIQGPPNQAVALIGDIMVTRLNYRGVKGCIVEGRIRDVDAISEICELSDFQAWAGGISAAPPSQEAVPWAVNAPLTIGKVVVQEGDMMVMDEPERSVVVIPQDKLKEVADLMPILKEASDRVIELVKGGSTLVDAIAKNPNFYSNYKK